MTTPADDASPLSLWTVLEQEVVSLGTILPADYQSFKAAHEARQAEARVACRDDPDRITEHCAMLVAARDLAERARVKYLFELLHEGRRTALCFSGGGIRSATFGLGVLHGLAHYSAAPGAAHPSGVLTQFDYLSTVSGGGYLGGWFSAWRHWHPLGMSGVVSDLAATPVSKLDPEPSALRYLRNYTAYLTPRTGLLSADTWTLLATTFRNMLLNWTVVLPLVAAVLMIPRIAQAVSGLDSTTIGWLPISGPQLLWALLVVAFVFTVIPTAYVARVLPSFGDYQGSQRQYFFGVLGPLAIAAATLATYWAWHIRVGGHLHRVAVFTQFGAAAHLAGAVVGAVLVFRTGLLSRILHLAVALAVSLAMWRLGGFWPGALAAPIISVVMVPRRYASIVGSAMLGALVTGALGGALGFLVATRLLHPKEVSDALYTTLAFPLILVIFGMVSLLLVAATSKFTSEDDREWWARSGAWLLIAVLVWVLFSGAVLYGPDLLRRFVAALAAAGGVTGIVASRIGFSGRTSSGRRDDQVVTGSAQSAPSTRVRDLVLSLAAPAFVVLVILLLAIVNDALLDRLRGWLPEPLTRPVRVELLAMTLLALPAMSLAFLVNINIFSLHGMYRNRLVRAFLGASNPRRRPDPFTGFDPKDDIPMRALGRRKPDPAAPGGGTPATTIERPLHVVNIALNLVNGDKLAWQQRKAESFTVTTLHAGSCRVGYQPTESYGGADGMHIGTAITISGAAASPNMGYHSSPVVTLLMALFNARLGWWLANPGHEGSGRWKLAGPRWAVTPWVHEAFGLTTDTSGWVYLSDGGHFENLGLYEMVLRRCRVIVVVDGGADPTYALEDLGNAVRKVRVDFGIPIEFPAGLPIRSRLDTNNAHCAVGEIQYRCVDGDRTRRGTKVKDGILIYIKATLNGNEPPDVSNYASEDRLFPQQPTSDQWFNEAQFESYRRLGSHSVDEIFGPRRPRTLAQFVHAAARHARRHAAAPAAR